MRIDLNGVIFTKNTVYFCRFSIGTVPYLGYRSIRLGPVHLHFFTSCRKLLNKPKKLPFNINRSNKRLIKPIINNPCR